jgi:hypothetical protein
MSERENEVNMICPVQGEKRERTLRSVLVRAGLWNIARLADQSGVEPCEVAAVLFNQLVENQTIYRLISVLNNTQGAGQWMTQE